MKRDWALDQSELYLPQRRVRDVLLEADGPQLVITVGERSEKYLAVLVDQEPGVYRWLETPLAKNELTALLLGHQSVGEALAREGAAFVDRDSRGRTVAFRSVKPAKIPKHALPRGDMRLPAYLRPKSVRPEVKRPTLLVDGAAVHENSITFNAIGSLALGVQSVFSALALTGESAALGKGELRMRAGGGGSYIVPIEPSDAAAFMLLAPRFVTALEPTGNPPENPAVKAAVTGLLEALVKNRIDIYPRWGGRGSYVSADSAARLLPLVRRASPKEPDPKQESLPFPLVGEFTEFNRLTGHFKLIAVPSGDAFTGYFSRDVLGKNPRVIVQEGVRYRLNLDRPLVSGQPMDSDCSIDEVPEEA